MRILITGASGNVGKGVAEQLRASGKHDLVLYDLGKLHTDLPFFQGDIQTGDRLAKAAEGCDVIVHTPAWHGIHMGAKTETDFWRLNCDGTFWMFQAAAQQGVKKVVFLSSIAWYNHYEKYGFTKMIGEELCEYYWRNHQIRYIALRPGSFTPWESFIEYGTRFLTFGVDRRDVLDAIVLAVENQTITNDFFVLLRDNVFAADELAMWKKDPLAVLEKRVPGSSELVRKYKIELKPDRPPEVHDTQKTKEILGWRPKHNFISFLEELKDLDRRGTVEQVRCDYPVFAF